MIGDVHSAPDIRKPLIVRPTVTILCRECELEGNRPLVAARLVNGELIVERKPHHGKPHPFKESLEFLLRLLAA